jgi:putative heme iron utilization protein
MFGGIRAIMVTIGRWGGVAMVVAMDDVLFECGRGLLPEVRRNLVIRVYVGLSTFNKWIFRVHL